MVFYITSFEILLLEDIKSNYHAINSGGGEER